MAIFCRKIKFDEYPYNPVLFPKNISFALKYHFLSVPIGDIRIHGLDWHCRLEWRLMRPRRNTSTRGLHADVFVFVFLFALIVIGLSEAKNVGLSSWTIQAIEFLWKKCGHFHCAKILLGKFPSPSQTKIWHSETPCTCSEAKNKLRVTRS